MMNNVKKNSNSELRKFATQFEINKLFVTL